MSVFKWNNPDPNVGYDIDKRHFMMNGTEYGDYEVLKRPQATGSSYIIPSNMDMGIPTERQNVRGEREYQMDSLLYADQSATMNDDMIQNVNNGRVHDVKIVPDITLPVNTENVMVKDNQESSVKGIIEENPISDLFFSDTNMDALQMGIRYGVHQKTKQVISNQSPDELYIIMRSIMLQYANFRTEADKVIDEIKRLNAKVLAYCIDNVSSNVQQYMQYIEDISKLRMPMEHPQYLNKDNYTYDMSNILQ